MKKYLANLGVSISQFLGTILGGDPDESISSRLGKRQADCRFCRAICRFLDLFDRDHCAKAARKDGDEGQDAVL